MHMNFGLFFKLFNYFPVLSSQRGSFMVYWQVLKPNTLKVMLSFIIGICTFFTGTDNLIYFQVI